jgi:hypothetical protein
MPDCVTVAILELNLLPLVLLDSPDGCYCWQELFNLLQFNGCLLFCEKAVRLDLSVRLN